MRFLFVRSAENDADDAANSDHTAASLAAHCHLELPQLHMAPSWECRTSCFASTSAPLAINSSATASSPFEHAMYSGVHLFYTRTPDQQLVANFRLTQISCQPTPLQVLKSIKQSIDTTSNSSHNAASLATYSQLELPQLHMASLPYSALHFHICSLGYQKVGHCQLTTRACHVQWCPVVLHQNTRLAGAVSSHCSLAQMSCQPALLRV